MFNSKRSVTDEQNERHKRLLAAILKEEGNKSCADCKTRNPTWASVNLGVFVCLTCSGIHRSLGVHISQVRSCNLDTWLPKQVEFCRVMGNVKGNRYWEARLPKDFRRPPSGNPNPELASFIRAKYVDQAFAAQDAPPPTIDNYLDNPYSKEDESAAAAAAPASAAPPSTASLAPAVAAAAATLAARTPSKQSSSSPALMTDLLGGFDDLAGSSTPTGASPLPQPASRPEVGASADPFGFGAFVSAQPAANTLQRNSSEWTDFHAAAAPSGSAAGAALVGINSLQHHRSASISEGVGAAASSSGQPSLPAGHSHPGPDPFKPVHAQQQHHAHHAHHHSSHAHHQAHTAAAHHKPAHAQQQASTDPGRAGGASRHQASASDPFASVAQEDLLAGLTIHHVMESLAAPFGGASGGGAADPFSFSSSAAPGDHPLPAPGAGHRRHPSHSHAKKKSSEEVLRLFDAPPSTSSPAMLAAVLDDPFGDFLGGGGGGGGHGAQNGGLKPPAAQVVGVNGGGVQNLL